MLVEGMGFVYEIRLCTQEHCVWRLGNFGSGVQLCFHIASDKWD